MSESRLRSTVRASAKLAGTFTVGFLAFVVVPGCDSSLDFPTSGTLSMILTVSPNDVSAGDTVVVSASSVGTLLLGTVLDYGDGFVDSVLAAGAQTQDVVCPKVYNQPGVFVVTATIDDANQGKVTRQDTVRVAVTVDSLPPSGPSLCEGASN